MAKYRLTLLILLLASVCTLPATATPLSGTRTIGPTGDYASIGAAIADVQSQTLGGALVLELQAAYVSTVETFPLTFTNLTTTAANTLTLRPQSGAVGLSIASANTTAATVDLNGAQFVTLDGRPGGAGTAKQLTIGNTSSSGVTVRFINEASSNIVEYLTLQGVNTGLTAGTVLFSTTTGADGNDHNTIDHCDIGDGGSTPTNALYSSGSTGTVAQNNSSNTVSNCNIFNFYSATAVDAAGVRLDGGNDSWIIADNSFYQTASRAGNGANTRAIYINNTAGNNFTVTGNFIGGSAANAGGTAWAPNGVAALYFFRGIQLNVGATTPTSVQGNTIQNIIWATSSSASILPGVWSGIYVQAGSVNIGTATGNTIGSGTGTGSISVFTAVSSGGTTFGIGSASSGTVAIANNAIGSITTTGATGAFSASLVGIQVTAGTNTIANNTVGSAVTTSSLNAAASSTSATAQQVTGILSSSSGGAIITGNTVANLNNNYAGTAATGQIRGIVTSAGVNTITGNTVRNLSTTSANVGGTPTSSVLGISQSSTLAGQTVSQNLVHSLGNTAASAAVRVIGIYYANATNLPGFPTSDLVARNLVHSLATASTSSASQLIGMYFDNGTFNGQNNMVRVGLQADGTSTAGASAVVGIYDVGAGFRYFYHNSVYVGGTQTSGANNTYACFCTGTTSATDFRNNIFVNARSNSSATSKHYAVQYSSPAPFANNNLFFVSGTGGVLGRYQATDRSTLAALQAATGQDGSSAVADPLFVNPTGTAATVDLHLQASNPAEGGGVLIAAVTDDFDGQTRSSLTPVDIGADAGSFTSTGDIFAPSVTYTVLSNGTTANRMLAGWASIVDNSGTVASGANAPRLYYKKSTDADAFVGNTSSANGWKYVTVTNGSSPYSFTVDYSIINGGSVSVGDSIQYFVVAQDAANNLASRPLGATASANPPVQNISAKPSAGVSSYVIVATLSGGTVTVGPSETIPNLTGAGGLFAALNIATLTSNLTVKLTGNTIEDGSTVLKAFTPPYTVTIQPDSAAMRTISSSSSSGLIRLNGAQRVTIDGSFGGSGRYLTFRSTHTSGTTITIINDASNNTVRSCVIEGATTSSTAGVVFFSTGVNTGNDNNTVADNQIRDRSDAAGAPANLIYSAGISAVYPPDPLDTAANSGNTISQNELFNFTTNGVFVASGSKAWSITGNTIHQTAAPTGSVYGIQFNGLGTNTIRDNTVRDLTTNGVACGIRIYDQTGNITVNTMVTGNRIWNLGNTPASTGDALGIVFNPSAGQSVTVVNNMVVLSSSGTTQQNLYGIYDAGQAGSTTLTAFNTVVLTGAGGTGANTWAFNSSGRSDATVKNNVFLNLRTGGGNHFAANRPPDSTGPLAMDSNVYAGTGLTTPANFFDSSDGIIITSAPISYAQWQANVPSDTHSSAGNPGGNFTSAMFVDAANGDLHLIPGGNALVNNAGTPVAGVMSDFDGQFRSATLPFVGADELASGNADLTGITLSAGGLSPVFAANTLSYTASVSNSTATLTFTPALSSGVASVTVNGGNAATPVPLSVGSSNVVTVVTTATDGTTTKTYTVIVTRQTTLETWRFTWFATTANTGNAADTADPYRTGVPNLAVFAVLGTGQDPALVSAGLVPQPQLIGGNYVITFTEPAGVTGVTYSAEWRADLSSGSWTAIGDSGTGTTHTFSLPGAGIANIFIRLRVTSQ